MKKLFTLVMALGLLCMTSCQKTGYITIFDPPKIVNVAASIDTVSGAITYTIDFLLTARDQSTHLSSRLLNISQGTIQAPALQDLSNACQYTINNGSILLSANGSASVVGVRSLKADGMGNYTIEKGTTKEFKITVTYFPSGSGTYTLTLNTLAYTTPASTSDYVRYKIDNSAFSKSITVP